MRYLAFLAIATFFTINALVSVRKEWFGFIYGIPGKDQAVRFVDAGLLSFFMVLGFLIPCHAWPSTRSNCKSDCRGAARYA